MKISPNTSEILKFSACITHAHVGVNEALCLMHTNVHMRGFVLFSRARMKIGCRTQWMRAAHTCISTHARVGVHEALEILGRFR